MAKPNVADVQALGEDGHGYLYAVTVSEGDSRATFKVWVAGSTSIEVQAGPNGPSVEWAAQRFRDHPWGLSNFEPWLPPLRQRVAEQSDASGRFVIPGDPGDG